MGFFSNRNVNILNLHLALFNLLDQSLAIFCPMYLYQQGFSIAAIFLLVGAFNVVRIPLRFLTFPIVRRLGLKTGVIIGATGFGLSFPILGMVRGWDEWLLFYMIFSPLFSAIHWLSFHTFYSMAGEHEKRGRQVAVGVALSTGLAALAPLLSAFTIVHTSFQSYFLLAFIVVLLIVAVLSRARNIPVAMIPWREGKKFAFTLGTGIQLTQAAVVYPQYCWMFAVYLYVGNLTWLGGVITFGIIMQIVYQLILGAQIDRGRGTAINHIAGFLRILQLLGKGLLSLSLPMILGFQALSAAGDVHHQASTNTAIYNAGKQATHPFWFWLFAEAAWDVGTAIGAGGAAFLVWRGVSLQHVILIALPPAAILWWMVYRYFKMQIYAATQP